MQMVHPSIFSSKTKKNSRQRHGTSFKMQHVATLFFFFFFLKKKFKKIVGVTFWAERATPDWPMATGVVRPPPRQNPQIFWLPVLPLRVAEPPPFGLGLVRPPPD
jgi:hypothetical protein